VKSLSLEQVKELRKTQYVHLKYVRVAHNFRFCVVGEYPEHRHLLADGECAVSAGFLSLGPDLFLLHTTPSTSLGIGPGKDDESLLKTLFGEL